MAITKRNIKHWYLMLTGKSLDHAKQGMGTRFINGDVYGYFNDLTNKVKMQPELLCTDKLPLIKTGKGDTFAFPVAIFQYGLGAYDCYLNTKDLPYLRKFKQCCNWAVQAIRNDGSWDNFSFIYPTHPCGAMCQGEGVSLLLRGYKEFHDETYLAAAKKALDFLLLPIEEGGTTLYENGMPVFLEYTNKPPVLNGWIFAFFGLRDYAVFSGDEHYCHMLRLSIEQLIENLHKYDAKFWSYYNSDGLFASPFYHNLHISQMQAMYMVTNNPIFKRYGEKWARESKNIVYTVLAFIIKAIQKIFEK